MDMEQTSIQLAWEKAYEMRACPKEQMLFSNAVDANLKSHLSNCEICKEKLESVDDVECWNGIAKKIAGRVSLPTTDVCPKVGQVWSLSADLDGWGTESRYLKAPRVILLKTSQSSSHIFRVAQLYTDRHLMGRGDIWLSEFYGYAEAWNVYEIDSRDLARCWGEVDEASVLAVLEAASSVIRIEDDKQVASVKMQFLQRFRDLESEVGEFISSRSLATSPSLGWIEELFNAPGKISDLIHSKFKSWNIPKLPEINMADDLFALLACAVPPKELAPVHGSSDEINIAVNFIKLSEKDLIPGSTFMPITSWQWIENNRLFVTGRLGEGTSSEVDSVLAFWAVGDEDPIQAKSVTFDPETGNVLIDFVGIDKTENLTDYLKILLIQHD